MEESRINCDHVCHARGLNPWVKACPTCGCANPKYDPAAESDIEAGERRDFLGELFTIMGGMGARPVRLPDDASDAEEGR